MLSLRSLLRQALARSPHFFELRDHIHGRRVAGR